jgi:peroxiredoxin
MRILLLSLLAAVSIAAAADIPAVGSAAPAFSLPDAAGKIRKLTESRGSTTVVFFYRGHW